MKQKSVNNGQGASSGNGPSSVAFRSVDMRLIREQQMHWWYFI
jgi:hypothetical protein